MTAPRITLEEVQAFEWPFRLRLPFRFGVITVTHGRQAVLRARIRLENGRTAEGMAAETLAAKWFDKDPTLTDEQNEHQLRRAIEIARDIYRAAGPETPFGLFANGYAEVMARAATERLPPLVAGFGPALLDRAILDAVLRAQGVSFATGMRANVAGMAPHPVIADLAGFDWDRFLASLAPRRRIAARHTVGLVDPITAADQAPGSRVEDGLPETLEEVCMTYRHTFFKLKVGGDVAADLDRLCRIAAVLDRLAPGCRVTLDGNEQYADAEGALALWRAIEAEPRLATLRDSVLFIEQPVRRAAALAADMAPLAAHRAVIVDESDGTLDAFLAARQRGYSGVSSKACKGFYKSLINLARCRSWNEAEGGLRYFMSGEDLTTLAGLCVQQDLALVALLGLEHVERNGHHFVDGFSGRPRAEADRFLAAHPGLYRATERGPRLAIADGMLDLASLDCAGFGAAVMPDTAAMEPMPKAAWPIS
ncbi:enolase C-terminal domain-like protein [Elioraea sp.]|uniref:enolase C-terminal domain-like protein n=1 Tax=Elioraea sp. TaxID=2185103 RepID=UPI00307D8746